MSHEPDHAHGRSTCRRGHAYGWSTLGTTWRPGGTMGTKHAGHSVAMFRDKFWLSLALTIPVVLLSHDIQEWFGYPCPMIPGIEYVPAILGTVIFFYGGMVFIRGAQGELARPEARDDDPDLARDRRRLRHLLGRHARPVRGRDLVGTRDPDHHHAARPLARDALDRPGTRRPRGPRRTAARHRRARRQRRHREVPLGRARASATSSSSARAPGSRPTASSTEGTADVDESMITGESRRSPRSLVTRSSPAPSPPAASCASGSPRSATRRRCRGSCGWSPRRRPRLAGPGTGRSGGRDPLLCRPRGRRDHARRLVAPRRPEGALVRTATVLVIACPHALGLAIPLVIAISTSLGARNGLLVKDRLALERARDARHRDIRQDRHPHQGRAGVLRRRRGDETEAASPGRRRRGRLRASARAGDRRRRDGAASPSRPRPTSRPRRAEAREPGSRATTVASAAAAARRVSIEPLPRRR